MIAYLSYFKLQLKVGLQYRVSALAGISTQFFWGILNIMIYQAMYQHAKAPIEMNYRQLVIYLWLNQAFFALIYVKSKDSEIISSIKDGTVAYELCRPYSLYSWWYLKLLAKKYASVSLRFLPIVLVAFFIPAGYGLSLPPSLSSFVLFLFTLGLGSLVLVGINMIVQILSFFTNHDGGISSIIYLLVELLSGAVIPIPLMPNFLKSIANVLPFRFIGDLAFRIYAGNILLKEAIISVGIQLFWIFILIFLGHCLMKWATKRVVIQGG